jgi:multicomponent Na+:H+ antiporter subunit G
MSLLDWVTAGLLGMGGVFFLAGTVGLVRFPDVHSRLHALTKADNLGLGFVVAGLIVRADTAALAVKLLAIWVLVLLASGTACYLIASEALRWRDPAEDAERGA